MTAGLLGACFCSVRHSLYADSARVLRRRPGNHRYSWGILIATGSLPHIDLHDSWPAFFLAPAFAAALPVSGPGTGPEPADLWRDLAIQQSPPAQRATPTLLARQYDHCGLASGDRWHLGLVLLYKSYEFDREFALITYYRQSRQQFVLPQDFQYGELLIPKGSLINRYDAFDNGEPQRPLRMNRLDAVRFAHPVQIAGVWAIAMDGHELELDRDQRISPVFHFDRNVNGDYGAWVLDPTRPYLDCQKGQRARFNVPLIEYDIQAEFGKPEPDGPDARFKPSQWAVVECSNHGPIEVKPAYTEAGPKNAQSQVWGPLQPSQ